MKSYLTHLECTYCNASYSAEEPHRLCGECGKVLYPRYDLDAARIALDRNSLRVPRTSASGLNVGDIDGSGWSVASVAQAADGAKIT